MRMQEAKVYASEYRLYRSLIRVPFVLGRFVLIQARVEEEAEKAAIEAENCEHIAKTVTVQQIDCERDLAAAVPAVLAAEEALKTLNKKDITELKNFTKPPPGVEKVTECVLLLFSPPKQLV